MYVDKTYPFRKDICNPCYPCEIDERVKLLEAKTHNMELIVDKLAFTSIWIDLK